MPLPSTTRNGSSNSQSGLVNAHSPNAFGASAELADEWGSEFVSWYNEARAKLEAAGLANQMPNLSDFVYSPNLWQQLMGAFGDESSKANFYNQSRAAIREDVNNLLATLENRGYNSPAAQAARLEGAGVNPALSNAVDNGNTEIPQDPTPDAIPEQQTLSPGEAMNLVGSVFSFTSSAMNIVQQGIQIGQGIETLAHTKNVNSIGEIKELFNAIPGLNKFLANLAPGEEYTDPETGEVIKEGTPIDPSKVSEYINSFGLRPEAQKLLKKLLGRIQYSEDGTPTTGYKAAMNELQAQSIEDAMRIIKGMSSPGYADNIKSWAANYNKLYGELIVETTRYDLERQIAIAKYDAKMHSDEMAESTYNAVMAGNASEEAMASFNEEYYNKLSPDAAAAAQNNAQRQRYVESQQMKYLANIENAYLKHYDRAIQDVYDRNLPKDQEDQLLAGIYAERNQFLAELAAQKHELITLAGKTIGDTDLLDAGADALGDALGFVGSLAKGKSKRPSKRYTH